MKIDPFDQIVRFLPSGLQTSVNQIEERGKRCAEEVRLRVGYPVSVVMGGMEYCPNSACVVSGEDLQTVLELASEHSVHTAMERMRAGYITVRGGHRIGICGEVIRDHGKIVGYRRPSSLNLRIAREVKDCAKGLAARLLVEDRLPNTLIIAPPGAGKTTLLRDLMRRISSGEETPSRRVGIVDERGELASLWNGCPQMDLGPRTDVLDGVSKAEGMLLMLRGMNPQVLAVDEITHPDDRNAIALAAGCGVSVFATIHGRDQSDLRLRPVCRELMQMNIFRAAVLVECGQDGKRSWRVEEIKC